MPINDAARILRGAALVLEAAKRRHSPEVVAQLVRTQQHLSDLVTTVYQVYQHHSQTSSHTHTHPHEAHNVNVDMHSTAAQQQEQAREREKERERERDIIGFDSLVDETPAPASVAQTGASMNMRERSIPVTPVSRFVGFGSLAVRMAMGAAVNRASALLSDQPQHGISEQNAERLAEALCRMRGAALKLGQMLSMDESVLPPALARALDRVRQSADYMPRKQLEQQLQSQLGHDWKSKFLLFEETPIAAASIGQVHKATLPDGTEVAVKIQYPGVAESIDSDLANLKRLVDIGDFLPPGLFVESIIKVASVELKEECDYLMEGKNQMRYRRLIMADPILRKHTHVPLVFRTHSTSRVLTSQLIHGIPIDKAVQFSQQTRNAIARTVLLLTVKELFEWRFIQSDPNFANFLYDHANKTIHLIDFGAARTYSKSFVDGYMQLVWAAANKDDETVMRVSKELKFITGDESPEFMAAHLEAGLVLGEPFLKDEPFDFTNSSLTARISKHGNTFMKHRLTPPPTEAYSLHRKLAGAFLLCIKLGASINCRDILETVHKNYKFGEVEEAKTPDSADEEW